MPFVFENSYTSLPARFYASVVPSRVVRPQWLALNRELGMSLGLTADELEGSELLAILSGNLLPPGAEPIAAAYAGHQFGHFVPQLGDGRAILLGELNTAGGRRVDLQLKGAGRTPFSRGGDGRAALGPVVREYLVSEAMHQLGVPTTRALAAVTSGEQVFRNTPLPGAVLARVASSHLRVGSFEYFACRGDTEALQRLTDYALRRHFPERLGSEAPELALLQGVVRAQARLVAKWMNLGFVHGVMNTDNCSIAGDTLDYGPCAFLDAYQPARHFSSVDGQGRYAFQNQPKMALWNLTRLAESLLVIYGEPSSQQVARLEACLSQFQSEYELAYSEGLCAKLGLDFSAEALKLGQQLLAAMAQEQVDFSLAFRRLTRFVATGTDEFSPLFRVWRSAEWIGIWQRLRAQGELPLPDGVRGEAAEGVMAPQLARMNDANPAYIPRNHQLELVIEAAMAGDFEPLAQLQRALAQPFHERPGLEQFALPPGPEQWSYVTFCGT